jgi:hypothetical protein
MFFYLPSGTPYLALATAARETPITSSAALHPTGASADRIDIDRHPDPRIAISQSPEPEHLHRRHTHSYGYDHVHDLDDRHQHMLFNTHSFDPCSPTSTHADVRIDAPARTIENVARGSSQTVSEPVSFMEFDVSEESQPAVMSEGEHAAAASAGAVDPDRAGYLRIADESIATGRRYDIDDVSMLDRNRDPDPDPDPDPDRDPDPAARNLDYWS